MVDTRFHRVATPARTRQVNRVFHGFSMMTKRQIIDRIIRLNRSATPEFLAAFSEKDLLAYLRQLCATQIERRRERTENLSAIA